MLFFMGRTKKKHKHTRKKTKKGTTLTMYTYTKSKIVIIRHKLHTGMFEDMKHFTICMGPVQKK